MIIPICESRLARTFADIEERNIGITPLVAGRVVHELIGMRTSKIGNVVRDTSGAFWLERASLDASKTSEQIPDSYLACSIDSFKMIASLNCAAGQLATLPRSQQWRYAEAEAALKKWVQANDPRCLDDPGSFWNELRRDDF